MEYLIAHTSWLDEMLGLCDSERGRLFTALLQYAASGEMQEPRGSERILYHKLIKCILITPSLGSLKSSICRTG